MPPDQQGNSFYSQYGVFWLYNWFQADNNNMNIFFLMNGNIFNYSLSYPFIGYAIPPNPQHLHIQQQENQYLHNHT
jgi:hypothetical protein